LIGWVISFPTNIIPLHSIKPGDKNMKFKSDKQRKAMFSRMNANDKIKIHKSKIPLSELKKLNFNQLQRKDVKITKTGDYDKDGVVNIKDCKPLDPKRQGILHDVSIKLLKKREELVEKKREKQLKELHDLKDKLNVVKARNQLNNAKIKEKQVIVEEINREKREIQNLKKQNQTAKRIINNSTMTGRVKQSIIDKSNKALNDTKKSLKKSAAKSLRNLFK